MKKCYWDCRSICRGMIQSYWFNAAELKDVVETYGIEEGDECRDSVVKLLLKTKKDFSRGFSFFTRESVDEKIMRLMRNSHCRCMNE